MSKKNHLPQPPIELFAAAWNKHIVPNYLQKKKEKMYKQQNSNKKLNINNTSHTL
ncbi:hypothetical protein [Chengkuizengella marina]|uniref:hypothetical protein n=1 Tax=Chengkuizengella marina TaxID=2507566 RepID=UPI00136ACE23|nr:hypothetical protein [Chengkuizengella marina]